MEFARDFAAKYWTEKKKNTIPGAVGVPVQSGVVVVGATGELVVVVVGPARMSRIFCEVGAGVAVVVVVVVFEGVRIGVGVEEVVVVVAAAGFEGVRGGNTGLKSISSGAGCCRI